MAATGMNDPNCDSTEEEDYDSDCIELSLYSDDSIEEISIDEEEHPDSGDEEMDSDVDYEHPDRGDEEMDSDVDYDCGDEEMDSDVDYAGEADDSFYVFKGHKDEVYSVACSPTNASLVATGGKDDKGFMWKIGSQDSRSELQGHKNTVSTLAFSFDGQFLATGSFDGVIQVWDANSANLKCTLEGSGGDVKWLKWHPKGHLILAGLKDCSVKLWNADKSAHLHTFNGHARSVTCGDFSPDGKIFCTGSNDASLRIWNPKTGESINVKGHGYHTGGLTCLCINHDSTIALTGSKDSSVCMVNLATGRVINSLVSHSNSVECIGLSPSFHWAATGSLDSKLVIWDIERSSPRCIFAHKEEEQGGEQEGERVTCLSWLGLSQYIATGTTRGKVRIWDSRASGCVRTFSGHRRGVESLSVTADLSSIVSVSRDHTARVFRIS